MAPNAQRPKGRPLGARSSIVVIGASEAMETLVRLLAQFPADFPGSIFIVHHMSADTNGQELLRALDRSGPLRCSFPEDGETLKEGHIYLAPPDHHMLLAKGVIRV